MGVRAKAVGLTAGTFPQTCRQVPERGNPEEGVDGPAGQRKDGVPLARIAGPRAQKSHRRRGQLIPEPCTARSHRPIVVRDNGRSNRVVRRAGQQLHGISQGTNGISWVPD
jgi:hypothetical protein